MAAYPDPYDKDEIDVETMDYEVNGKADIKKVVAQLCQTYTVHRKLLYELEYDEIVNEEKIIVNDVVQKREEDDRFVCLATGMLYPWLERDNELVRTAIREHPEFPYSDTATEKMMVNSVIRGLDDWIRRADVQPEDGQEFVDDYKQMVWNHAEQTATRSFEPSSTKRVQDEVLQYRDPKYADEPGEIEDHERIRNKERVVHGTAMILIEDHDYLYPEHDVQGWRKMLYVYDEDKGIYRPRGEEQVEEIVEDGLKEYSNNNTVKQVVGKIERRSRVDSWDMQGKESDPYRVVCENGIVDLRTGELHEYTPHEYHRKRIDVEYDPDAECPEIDDFFHDIVADEDVPALYRLIASTLVDEVIDEKAALLVGSGSNGKSTFLELVEEFVSDRNSSARSLTALTEDRWAPADLHGALANVSADVEENDEKMDNLSVFKRLTGGDTFSADRKYENPVDFTNTSTLLFAANGVPRMPDTDTAVWRRWVYLNFPYTFKSDTKVPRHVLMDRLTNEEEMKGLLSRCVKEVSEWKSGDRNEFYADRPDWDETRRQMMRAADPVYSFFEDCVAVVESDEVESESEMYVAKDELHEAYQQYAMEENMPTIAYNQFCRRVKNDVTDYSAQIDDINTTKVSDGVTQTAAWKPVTFTRLGEELLSDETDDDGEEGVRSTSLDDDFGELPERIGGVEREDVRRYIEEHPNATPEDVRSELMIPIDALTEVERVVERWGNSLGEELAGDRDE